MKRDYLIYSVAVSAGFIAYLVLDHGFGVNFGMAMLAGFAVIHAGIVLGRRYF